MPLINLYCFLIENIKDMNEEDKDDCSFPLIGLRLEGARCDGRVLTLTAGLSVAESTAAVSDDIVSILRWKRSAIATPHTGHSKDGSVDATIPVYYDGTRSHLLFTVELECEQSKRSAITEHAVAYVASSLGY